MEKNSKTKILNKTSLLILLLISALMLNIAVIGVVLSTPEQSPVPIITVAPDPYIATHIGETVIIRINIERVDSELQLIGAQWKLKFNTTILEILTVTEGNFFADWAEAAGVDPSTIYFWWLQEDDYVISFTLHAEFAVTPPTLFPEGSGTLATVTFNATHGPPANCKLDLSETMLTNVDLEEILPVEKDGYYKCLAQTAPEDVPPLHVEVITGATHFRGEIALFHTLITYKGIAVNASLYLLLYEPDGSIETLTPIWIAQGFYEIQYEIAGNASTGIYTLLVEADYNAPVETGVIETTGTSFECFQVSPTLTAWNKSIEDNTATIESIEDDIATIVIPYLGQIKVNLTAIDAKLVSIDQDIATIDSTIGTIQASLGTIEGQISDIEAVQGTTTTLQYTTLVLALIAAIGAVLILVYARKT